MRIRSNRRNPLTRVCRVGILTLMSLPLTIGEIMLTYIPAREIRPTDVVLYGSSGNATIVFGSTVERVSEYDESIYVEYDDGFSIPFGMDETVTVMRVAVTD